jgi:hypothetical protein
MDRKNWNNNLISKISRSYTSGYFLMEICEKQCLSLETAWFASPAIGNLRYCSDNHSVHASSHFGRNRISLGRLQGYKRCSHRDLLRTSGNLDSPDIKEEFCYTVLHISHVIISWNSEVVLRSSCICTLRYFVASNLTGSTCCIFVNIFGAYRIGLYASVPCSNYALGCYVLASALK